MRVHPTFDEVLTVALDRRSRSAATTGFDRPSYGCSGATDYVRCHARADAERAYVETEPEHAADAPAALSHEPIVVLDDLDAIGLRRLRRELARRYHPDCLPSADAVAATRQMSQINHLIDEALASVRAAVR